LDSEPLPSWDQYWKIPPGGNISQYYLRKKYEKGKRKRGKFKRKRKKWERKRKINAKYG
jgi:hypothetical protein